MNLEVNEWQISSIHAALTEADSSAAVFIDHDEVLARWEKKVAAQVAAAAVSRP
ncbi:MAG: hypothetical protein ACYC9M_11395 [Desulfobulbaceae bacterium]